MLGLWFSFSIHGLQIVAPEDGLYKSFKLHHQRADCKAAAYKVVSSSQTHGGLILLLLPPPQPVLLSLLLLLHYVAERGGERAPNEQPQPQRRAQAKSTAGNLGIKFDRHFPGRLFFGFGDVKTMPTFVFLLFWWLLTRSPLEGLSKTTKETPSEPPVQSQSPH
ncbi:unnamed protein product, partial [Ectocarpus sp. 12 AP-2014]